jgi:hypothetical protein
MAFVYGDGGGEFAFESGGVVAFNYWSGHAGGSFSPLV